MDNPCDWIDNMSIIVHKQKVQKRIKYKIYIYDKKQEFLTHALHNSALNNNKYIIRRYSTMPNINEHRKDANIHARTSDKIIKETKKQFQSKYFVNMVSEYRTPENFYSLHKPPIETRWKVYRCQLSTKEESCCCSCNSDAMFEVMKSLYDCYKKKNCDHCNCILCGHLHREERRLGAVRKSLVDMGMKLPIDKAKLEKAKSAGLLTPLEGKSPEEKEKIVKGLAMLGLPLPVGKTASEKKLINKVRAEVGLPPEPKTSSLKEKYGKAINDGVMLPLQGKTPAEKEKILKDLANRGIPLPEGRTSSEKALITKVKSAAPKKGILSEKLRRVKAAGLMTPLAGKTPEQKEKILRGLAMEGLPLPVGDTPSVKKLINKVRADLGLPPEPKTPSLKEKYDDASNEGVLIPLEGKTPAEKEKILRDLANRAIPLPVGRTPSEKSLIAKVKAAPTSKMPLSERVRIAKAAGLVTSLKGKTPQQKENIIRGLAMAGLPIPEGKTPSEKKLIDKVRGDLGLPPEPKTPSLKEKYKKVANEGLMVPLEGKTPAEKEKILQAMADRDIPLPEGRTPSEKALVTKVKARTPPVSSEKLRRAEAAGLLTPLTDKTPGQKEKILRGLAMEGIPLPEGKTPSEKKLIDKLRNDLGLPPEPKTPSIRHKYNRAANEGVMVPLEGKTPAEKEKILQALADRGILLPEGRTPSEKALVAKVKARTPKIPSEKLRRAKAAGVLTPLAGKAPEQKEKILKVLAMEGLPLPAGTTPSEKKLIDKVRNDLGLPPEPKTPSIRAKYNRAANEGVMIPLEGKTPAEKEKILQALSDRGISLPKGRTPLEKALVAKVKARTPKIPSEKLRRAKTAGLLTPLADKTPEQKEKILKGLAMEGLPLPEGTTPSEKNIIDKVRNDLGLPPEPKTPSLRGKYDRAANEGVMVPLEGKTPAEKEKILQDLADRGIPLPESRTPSEKALVAKVKARTPKIPSEKLRRAKAAGLLTPLADKTLEQKEQILRGLAMEGLPLPEGTTPSEKKLIDKVRHNLGLPPEPKTPSIRDKYNRAANEGVMVPLEGKKPAEKEKILQALTDRNIPLPEGRTSSEKALVAKVKARTPKIPSEKLRRAKAAGLLTPLLGKTPEQIEKIMKGLAMEGLPLPESTTPSEKKLIDKIRNDLGLPPEPKSSSMRGKYNRAANEGIIVPLEGKTPAEKEKILQALVDRGIPLPQGRTPSEKALVANVKARTPKIPSEKLLRAKAAGLLTPLVGKTPQQIDKILKGLAMEGLPLPESTNPSEKKIIDKVRNDLGLPPEPETPSLKGKYNRAANEGVMVPLEGKTPAEKEKILQALADRGIPLPEGRTPTEKALVAEVQARTPKIPSEKLRRAKAAGLLTPLVGKTPEQIEKILKGLAMEGLPLPKSTTPSEKKIIDKIRNDLGLPPEPKTPSIRHKYNRAANEGIIVPLEGKTPAVKKKILQALADRGIPLPEGRTPTEKALVAKVKARTPKIPSEKLRRAKAAGLLTPLADKTPEQKEQILRGLAMEGLPLPEGTTPSEKKLIDKVRNNLGLPPEPKTPSIRDKYNRAANKGVMVPLEGKKPAEKEKILQALADRTIPLPEGRTPSEKALVAKVKARTPKIPSEKLRRAKAAGLLTPLVGKTPEQIEKILKGLAMEGLPLPESTTPSEKKMIDKVRNDLGLPPEPKTPSLRGKYNRAANEGVMVPLEGKTPAEKEKILQALADRGIPLPEGRTSTEKGLVAKVKARTPKIPSEKLRRAKAAGLLTPLAGKTPEQKEKILRGLAIEGLPLPVGTTPSVKKLIGKVRNHLGLPPEPKTPSIRDKYNRAVNEGVIAPLEGKTPAEKEKILQALADRNIPLPEGRTPSEKALVAKVTARPRKIPSEKLRSAKAAGLLTPLEGKTPEQKEKILRGLAKSGLPLPESKTPSEKKLIDKVRADFGLPPEPRTPSIKQKYAKAQAAGLITPLEGKTPSQKEKILRGLADMGVPLPEGRTPSEKAMVSAIKGAPPTRSITTEKIKQAKEAGLLTPLADKTPEQKEKILKGLAKAGLPLPEGKTLSEKALVRKVKSEFGIPEEPLAERVRKAQAAGFLTPLSGKTPAQKEKILRGMTAAGLPLPQGKTPSEKALIKKVKADSGYMTPSKSEKMRKAEASGLLTPLKGKTPSTKEKLLKARLATGLPLPEYTTSSEKELIKKISVGKTPSEKLRRAKAAGLLTPLQGKTPDQKEKILRGLAKAGLPLPEPQTASERSVAKKIRNELGLPLEPTTPSMKKKYKKAQSAGIITPLEGKTPTQKEKILKNMQDAGIPLPEGRSPSEKAVIRKLQEGKTKSPSQKLKEAKAAGLLTPLKGKSPAEKEKNLKGLAKIGLPLPEAKTPSEKDIINKVRKDLGLPPEPTSPFMKDKMRIAHDAGLITPLEGKTHAQKEKILKDLAKTGISLPEGRTPSEKAIIKQLKKPLTPSERKKKAKASLEGKSPEEKAATMNEIAMLGLPLPEPKTTSEKDIADKVRKELGLPPEPKTPAEKERYDSAQAAGLIEPLEGKSPAEKARIVKRLADMGLPLPEGRTPSEKSMIAKVKAENRTPISSEKLRKAKAAGILTPIDGKTPAEKDQILRNLAEAGLPLPLGKTPSEKSMIRKLKAELGIPPSVTTPSEKEVMQKAKAEELFTPLTGKTPEQKEKILKGLVEAGLPLPEGKTASEKGLIKKVKAAAGLTPSEKKAKKVSPIKQEIEDIVKNTKCDRACGCDKKKIRFKHSYVKIRVTSPDISSFCSCPDECIPGVKSGIFTDNEGIKVTIGSAVGVPSRDYGEIPNNSKEEKHVNTNDVAIVSLSGNHYFSYTDVQTNKESSFTHKSQYETKMDFNKNKIEYIMKINNKICYSDQSLIEFSENYKTFGSSEKLTSCINQNRHVYLKKSENSMDGSIVSHEYIPNRTFSRDYSTAGSSFSLLLVVKTDSSLGLSISDSFSSVYNDSRTTEQYDSLDSFDYLRYPWSDTCRKLNVDELEPLVHGINYEAIGTLTSDSNQDVVSSTLKHEKGKFYNKLLTEYLVFTMSQNKLESEIKNKTESVVIINNLNNYHDIMTVVDEILTKRRVSDASIFVVVPNSYENNVTESSCDLHNSSVYIQLSEASSNLSCSPNTTTNRVSRSSYPSPDGNGPSTKPAVTSNKHEAEVLTDLNHKLYNITHATRNKRCQVYVSKDSIERRHCHRTGTDTTEDRPCCCMPEEPKNFHQIDEVHDQSATCVLSQLLTPVVNREGVAEAISNNGLLFCNKSLTIQSKFMPTNETSIDTLMRMCNTRPCWCDNCHQHIDTKLWHRRKSKPSHKKGPQPCLCGTSKSRPDSNRRKSERDKCGHAIPDRPKPLVITNHSDSHRHMIELDSCGHVHRANENNLRSSGHAKCALNHPNKIQGHQKSKPERDTCKPECANSVRGNQHKHTEGTKYPNSARGDQYKHTERSIPETDNCQHVLPNKATGDQYPRRPKAVRNTCVSDCPNIDKDCPYNNRNNDNQNGQGPLENVQTELVNAETNTNACDDPMCPIHVKERKLKSELTQTNSSVKISVDAKTSPPSIPWPWKRKTKNTDTCWPSCADAIPLERHHTADASSGYPPRTPPPTLADEYLSQGFKLSVLRRQQESLFCSNQPH